MRWWVVLVVVLLAVGCGDDAGEPAPHTTPTTVRLTDEECAAATIDLIVQQQLQTDPEIRQALRDAGLGYCAP